MKIAAHSSKKGRPFALMLLPMLVLSGCVSGSEQAVQPEQSVQSDQAAIPGSPEARAELALRLAAQARRDEDARAMLVAARLMLTSGTRPATVDNGELAVEAGGDPVAAGWAREAMVFAGADEALREEAQAVLAMRPRGVLRSSLGAGPLRYVRRVAANETIRITIRTETQLAARVAVIGDGDARIGLTVASADTKICEAAARNTHSSCNWQARFDRHSVTLVNAGPLDSDVMLLSN